MERDAKASKPGAKPAASGLPRKRTASAADTRLSDALAQQAATAEILRVMAAASHDVQPVLAAIAEQAARLCRAPFARVVLVDGDVLRPSAQFTADGESATAMHVLPLSRASMSGRATLDRATVHVADIVPLLDREYPDARENALATGFRASLAIPLMGDGIAHGAIFLWRREVGLFPPDQVALVETFARQAAIAIENVRQFHATQEALEQQTATSEILRVISSSPTDVKPVFEAIVRNAVRLCNGDHSFAARFDGEFLHPLANHGFSPEALKIAEGMFPMRPSLENMLGRAALARAVVNLPDMLADPTYSREFAMAGGWRSGLAVPMMRDGELIGAIAVSRRRAGAFSASQVALLQTFADQAVIAIENVRLFTELGQRNDDLTETLEQQTATGEILSVISRSQIDVQPVFETIAENALRLCDGVFSAVYRFDGELIHMGALRNITPEGDAAFQKAYPCPPSRGGTTQRAILTRSIVHMPDVRDDPEYAYHDVAEAAGFRSVLSVPMLRDGEPIGTITVYRDVARPFPQAQIDLLQTFADQAVIAIENVRLFNELEIRNRDLTEALEQQTATSDILRVISRSQIDVQPVFDTIATAVLKLCGAEFTNVFTFDGTLIHLAAFVNVHTEYIEVLRARYPMPPGRATAVARAIETGLVCTIADVLADPDYEIANASAVGGFRSILAVPLLREGKVIGGIAVGRPEAGEFPDSQIALVQTFADQAVIAIENVRLFNELDARNRDLTEALEQQTATSDILRVISQSPTDVQPVFDTIAAAALKLCGATNVNVFTFDGELIHLAALVNLTPAGADAIRRLWPQPPSRGMAATRAIVTGSPVAIPDVLEDPDFSARHAAVAGNFRSILAVPLTREGRPIGAIAVGRPEPGQFPDAQIALLQTFADQAVIAIENVRLFTELEARTAQLTRSVGELRALGEVGQAVSSTLDLGTVLSTIVARATQLTGMDGGSIYEYDEAREAFFLHSADGLPDELLEAARATPIRKGEGALGRMAFTREPVQIPDIADETTYQSRVRTQLLNTGYRSLLAVPLLREDHLLGGLAVNRKTPGAFDPQVIELLKTFATQSAIAIQNARLFREIEIKSRELETASRHKSEFLANMSHELRTPLNAIIGFSEVLTERLFGDMNEKQTEYVADIADSGRHLLELINDILDLSKIEAGRMELDVSDFDLPKSIGQTLSLVRERAERRRIVLASSLDTGVASVRGDQRKVKQVVLNLLSNALKFTPEGGRIDVRAVAFDDRVEVSVADTGVGIAPEDQEAVFEEFRQVGASAARVEGTGLGLAISRKFIELHGGRLWLASEVGKGSTFTFSLPR